MVTKLLMTTLLTTVEMTHTILSCNLEHDIKIVLNRFKTKFKETSIYDSWQTSKADYYIKHKFNKNKR